MIADGFEQRAFLRTSGRQLDEGLKQAMKKTVAPKRPVIEVFVHLYNVARTPELHQSVDLVDERSRLAFRIVSHALPFALVPCAKPDSAAGALFDLGIRFFYLCTILFRILCFLCRATGANQNFVL